MIIPKDLSKSKMHKKYQILDGYSFKKFLLMLVYADSLYIVVRIQRL